MLLTQATLLNCVGMMYCGDERLMRIAKTSHSGLVGFCDGEWSRSKLNTNYELLNSTKGVEQDWKLWCNAECRRRTGYCIWVSESPGCCITELTTNLVAFGLYVGFSLPDATVAIFRGRKNSDSLSRGPMGGRLSSPLATTL